MKGTIIYYGGFSLPDKNAAANRVVNNGKLFDSLGFKTVFLGADYGCHFGGINKLKDNMYEEAHPTSSSEWLKNILCFLNLKRLVSNYEDVKMVLLYNVPFITLLLAKSFFSKKGITVSYDCTEWSQYTEGSFLKKVFKYIDEFFVRCFAHRVADKMIVISKMMEKAYKSNPKLLRLPPLVDVDNSIWHQKIEKDTRAFTFCFAGFPGGNKESLDKVVEAFSELYENNIKLKIVGMGCSEFEKLYPNVKINDKKYIEFLGKQTHEETIKNILACDCYIFIRPSDRRNNAGFPTKFVESFTCGVPIITTDVSDIKDYISFSEGSVLLENCQKESIKNAMKLVLEKPKAEKAVLLKTNFHYAEYSEEAGKWLE